MKRFSADLPLWVSEESFHNRLFSLNYTFDCLSARLRRGIDLDQRLLRHALTSYYIDLDRMKGFHNINFADQHKRAAFLMIWIARIHPIQIDPSVPITPTLVAINEIYALHVGLNHMKLDIDAISTNYICNLLYILHFRPITGEVLSSAMYLLECACTCRKP